MDSDSNPHPILGPEVRTSLEAAVSAHLGLAWQVKQCRDLADLASHPSAILSDGSFAVFAKFGRAPEAAHQFEVESASLAYLAAQAGVRVPTAIGVVKTGEGALFLMEALTAIPRGPRQWGEIGQALAAIHRVKSNRCGFHQDNYFGPLLQDNTSEPDWPTFYAEHRLRPHLKMAIDSGHLPPKQKAQVETILRRLPELCGPPVAPTLLHGDAQQNNFISTPEGAYIVDPAIHFGHPELDLAYIDYFQPVPPDVLGAYQQELPIDPSFPARRKLWRLATDLALVALEGDAYMGRLAAGLETYL
jgi:fructosamine-3-kinase